MNCKPKAEAQTLDNAAPVLISRHVLHKRKMLQRNIQLNTTKEQLDYVLVKIALLRHCNDADTRDPHRREIRSPSNDSKDRVTNRRRNETRMIQ